MEYLIRRKGHYYFRIAVPRDLIGMIGRREVKKSLKTQSLKHAKPLVKVWSFRIEKLFFMVRSGMLTEEQIHNIVEEFFEKTLKEAEEDRARTGIGMVSAKTYLGEDEHPIDQILEVYSWLASEKREDLVMNNLKPYEDAVDALLQEKGLKAERGSPEHRILCREYLKKLIQALEIDEERVTGNYDNWYDKERQQDKKGVSRIVAIEQQATVASHFILTNPPYALLTTA